MANYCCAIRTNYFKVKNEDQFRAIIEKTEAEDDIKIWKVKDSDGNTRFGFGLYGRIFGLTDCEHKIDYGNFIQALQCCVADDDAILIFESGNEKLRYMAGIATVITSNKVEHLDVEDIARRKAAELLNNDEWDTQCSY